MGMIRGALVTILTILLFVSILSSAILLTVTLSLSYDTAQPEIADVVSQMIRDKSETVQNIDEGLQEMQIYCQNHTDFVQSFDGRVFELPCDVVAQGTEPIIDYVVADLVEEVYYQEYDCSGRACLSLSEGDDMFFLFSKRSQDYWRGWFTTSLIVTLILLGLIFMAMEDRNSFPFLAGIVAIVVSLPFLGFGKLLGLVAGAEYIQILSIFFLKSYTTFLIYLIVGIVLIALGIILKFISVGRFFGRMFGGDGKVSKKDIKQAVKEEIKESKPKKKKK